MIFSMAVSLSPPHCIRDRGKALGYNTAVVYVGLSAGPVIGGFLTQQASWRAIFVVVAVFAGFTWLYARRIRSDCPPAQGERFDTIGAVLYCLALTLLMSAVTLKGAGILLGVVASVLLFAFGVIESRQAHPLLDLQMFRESTVFTFSALAALLNYGATFSVGHLLLLYLQTVRGFTPRQRACCCWYANDTGGFLACSRCAF